MDKEEFFDDDLFIEADALHEPGDFEGAFAIFEQCANKGDHHSMLRLASMYTTGEGVLCDYDKAIEWEKKALGSGDTAAMYNLGITYRLKGELRQARYWFEQALERGDGEGAYELARLLIVSDKERETVRNYLQKALADPTITEGTREEAQEMLSVLDR